MVVKDRLLIGGTPKKMQKGKVIPYKGLLVQPVFWFAPDMIHIVSWELEINQQNVTSLSVADLEKAFHLTVEDVHEINRLILGSDL